MALLKIVEIRAAKVPITWPQLLGMVLRKSLTRDLTSALTLNHKSNTGIGIETLEAHALAGGCARDLVLGMKVLRDLGQDFPVLGLAALDLGGHGIVDLVSAFAELKRSFPHLDFAEVSNRVLRGEDVISAFGSGDFRPLAEAGGWVLRAEWSGLGGAEIADYCRRLPRDAVVRVLRPNGQEWEPWREDLIDGGVCADV